MATFDLYSSNAGVLNAYVDYSVNGTNVSATLYVRKGSSTSSGSTGHWRFKLTIGGQGYVDLTTSSQTQYIFRDWVAVASYNGNISGTGRIYAYVTGPTQTAMANYYCEGHVDITTVTAPTLTSFYLASRTVNSLTFTFNCSKAETWYYKLSTSGEYIQGGSGVTTGSFTLNNLNPNTSYTVNLRLTNWAGGTQFNTDVSLTSTTFQIAQLSSVPNDTIGYPHTITWTNMSNAQTSLKLCKTNGEIIENYGNVTGLNKTITPNATTIYRLTPYANTYRAKYILTTTVNNKAYTSEKEFDFIVANSNPTFSNYSYQDINAVTTNLTKNNQILIKGFSKLRGIISASNKAQAKNEANMTDNGAGYKFTEGNANSNTASYKNTDVVIDLPNVITTNNFTMSAIDSRGNTTPLTKTLTDEYFKSYTEFICNSFTATRSNNGVGQAVTIKFDGTFWNNKFGNTNDSITNTMKNITYSFKATNKDTYSQEYPLNISMNGNRFSGEQSIAGDLGANGFDVSKSFNIKLTLRDELSTKSYIIVIGSGTPAIAIYKDKVAIGQKYDVNDSSYRFQVNGAIKADGNVHITGQNSTVEGGEIQLFAPKQGNQYAGTILDNYGNSFRIFGIPSKDGTTKRGAGTPLYINPYDKTITGGYTFTGNITGNVTGNVSGNSGTTTKLNVTSLYDNGTGTNGTVTLSETVANFTFVDIYFRDNDWYHYMTRIYAPNDKSTTLIALQPMVQGTLTSYLKCKSVLTKGTTITVIETRYKEIGLANGGTVSNTASNIIFITKVVGYK